MVRKLLPIYLLITLIFIACTQATNPEDTESPVENEAAADQPTASSPTVEDETIEATKSIPPTEPVVTASTPVEPANDALPLPTESPVEPTETEILPTVEPAFNGPYENTYFRGSAAAPVTMIDYSDFL